MRRLGAWRYRTLGALRRAGTAIAKRKDAVIVGGLHRRAHHQAIAAIDLQAIQRRQKVSPFDARRPQCEVGFQQVAVFGLHTAVGHFGDHGIGHHLDAECL